MERPVFDHMTNVHPMQAAFAQQAFDAARRGGKSGPRSASVPEGLRGLRPLLVALDEADQADRVRDREGSKRRHHHGRRAGVTQPTMASKKAKRRKKRKETGR